MCRYFALNDKISTMHAKRTKLNYHIQMQASTFSKTLIKERQRKKIGNQWGNIGLFTGHTELKQRLSARETHALPQASQSACIGQGSCFKGFMSVILWADKTLSSYVSIEMVL